MDTSNYDLLTPDIRELKEQLKVARLRLEGKAGSIVYHLIASAASVLFFVVVWFIFRRYIWADISPWLVGLYTILLLIHLTNLGITMWNDERLVRKLTETVYRIEAIDSRVAKSKPVGE